MYRSPDFKILTIEETNPPELSYGVKMIGAPLEWPETRGKGIKVAVIDTGAPKHPDVKVTEAIAFAGGDAFDERGHGSHTSGIIAANGKIKGVAPEVDLYCLKVAEPKSRGGLNTNAITKALEWCCDNGIDVINMSLGGPTNDSEIEKACKACYDAGIAIICSAGNLGLDFGVMYPAHLPTTIAVAAVDVNKVRPGFSAVGKELDIAAAGVEVCSTWLDGKYALLSGTSMAAPHITGAVALLQAKALIRLGTKLTPDEVKKTLKIYAEDLGIKGPDDRYGCGVFSFGRFDGSEVIPQQPSQEHQIDMWINNPVVEIDGIKKELPVEPILHPRTKAHTMVPVRFISDELAKLFDKPINVGWNEKEQRITIKTK